jgi:hypothetical protein
VTFLGQYDEVDTVYFGADKKWWVKVRKHLARGEFKVAQTALVEPVLRYKGTEGETSGKVDSVSYQDQILFASIIDWNLTGRDGAVLPLGTPEERRASINALPEEVFEEIIAVTDAGKVRGKAPAEQFRKDGEAGAVEAGTGAAGAD